MLGKLPSEDLYNHVLKLIERRRKEITVPAAIGEDCALIETKGRILVTCDPITSATANLGKLALYVTSNDVAASGGEPVAAFLTIIARQGEPLENIGAIMADAESVAKELNIQIAGGHTEYSDAVNRTIVSCTMVGFPLSPKVFSGANIKEGESVILTGSIAKEFAVIQAFDDEKLQNILSQKELDDMRAMADDLSIIRPAKVCTFLPVSAMHDVTEGGVFGAIEELLENKELACRVSVKNISVHPTVRKICRFYSQDPYKAISSGNLLIVTRLPKEVLKQLKKIGVEAEKIGEITSGNGLILN